MENLRLSLRSGRTMARIRFHKSLKVKRSLIVLNIVTIAVSPIAYMPLATMQAAYVNKCFLDSEIKVTEDSDLINNTKTSPADSKHHFIFSMENSELGSESTCSYITYGLVSLQIISIITLWHIMQLWGEMMSIGNGGAMAVLLSIVYLATSINCYWSFYTFSSGFRKTCSSIAKIETKSHSQTLSCESWKEEIKFAGLEDMDVIQYMFLAKSVQFFLIFVEASKVFNCVSVSFVTHHSLEESYSAITFR